MQTTVDLKKKLKSKSKSKFQVLDYIIDDLTQKEELNCELTKLASTVCPTKHRAMIQKMAGGCVRKLKTYHSKSKKLSILALVPLKMKEMMKNSMKQYSYNLISLKQKLNS
jgi:hypothetical protein